MIVGIDKTLSKTFIKNHIFFYMVFLNLESKVFQAFLKEVLEGFFYKAWCLGKLD